MSAHNLPNHTRRAAVSSAMVDVGLLLDSIISIINNVEVNRDVSALKLLVCAYFGSQGFREPKRIEEVSCYMERVGGSVVHPYRGLIRSPGSMQPLEVQLKGRRQFSSFWHNVV